MRIRSDREIRILAILLSIATTILLFGPSVLVIYLYGYIVS